MTIYEKNEALLVILINRELVVFFGSFTSTPTQ